MLEAMEVLAPGDGHIARRTVLADLVLTLSLGLLQHRLIDKDDDTARVVVAAMDIIRAEVASMSLGADDTARTSGSVV
jgi:hypothetical protein